MAKRILIRRDTTANWQSVNPILSNGELGIEIKTDGTRSMKLGTGSVAWNSLGYFLDNPALALQNHENDTSAHGATATPTANSIVMYNSANGLKSDKTPVEANDVLRKSELDTINGDISGLQSDIDALETDLADEVSRAETAEGILTDNLADEVTNRTNADADLQDNIDTLETNLATEISDRQTAVSNAISTAATDATTKAGTAESNAKEYADDLALATQKWLPAVQTSADLPVNPGDGTYLCRVITGTDYGVYQWIGSETTPAWSYFSDNLDFIDRIANPTTDNIPIITASGELTDSGTSIADIESEISTGLATKEDTITAGTTSQYYRGDKTWQTFPSINDGILTIQKNGTDIDTFSANANANKTINIALSKSDVELSNVDNTADADKPISTLAQTALNGKVDKTDYYIYRPDLWPFNVEIDFGQGLYGRRSLSSGTNVAAYDQFWVFYITGIDSFVDFGGWVKIISNSYVSPGTKFYISNTNFGYLTQTPTIPFTFQNTWQTHLDDTGGVSRINFFEAITSWNSDVWATYKKI